MQKKLAMLLIVALVSSMLLFAGITEGELWEIESIAAGLDSTGKLELFEKCKKDNGSWESVLNFLIGAGLGSFVQGDMTGGIIGLTGEVLGYSLLGASYIKGKNEISKEIVLLTSLATLVVIKCYEFIRPVTFASSFNKKLLNAVMGDVDLAVLPVMDKKVPGVALVGSIRF